MWACIACRRRCIDERLSDSLNEVDAVVVLGATPAPVHLITVDVERDDLIAALENQRIPLR